MQVVQFWWECINKIAASDSILRVAAVDGVSGKDRRVAQILKSAKAVRAVSVNTANPGNTHARTQGQLGGCSVDNISHNLVAGDEGLLPGRQFAFDDVEIRTADAAGADAKENFTGSGLRLGSFFNPKRLLRDSEDGGFHWLALRSRTALDLTIGYRLALALLKLAASSGSPATLAGLRRPIDKAAL
jgi:hypothetical protein